MWAMAGPAAFEFWLIMGPKSFAESANKIDAVRTLEPFLGGEADPDKSGIFHNMNAGKRGLALDLSKSEAIDVVWDLIDWADVILESFSPKAMTSWGLDYAQVAKRKPEVIMASSCLMGQTGPLGNAGRVRNNGRSNFGFLLSSWLDRSSAVRAFQCLHGLHIPPMARRIGNGRFGT